jgi:hypothetical protein
MNDNLTADHIYDTYRRYPGYRSIIKLEVNAVWSNWLTTEEVLPDRLLECKDGHEDAINYGYAAIIVDSRRDPPVCERWHPQIDGVGFAISEFSKMGQPTEIQIFVNTQESTAPLTYKIPHYPCETMDYAIGYEDDGTPINSKEYVRDKPLPEGYGFFIIRTRGGKRGVRGLPQYLDLIMPIRKAYDIIENYATYAENQALAHPAAGIKDWSKQKVDSIKNEYNSAITHKKLLIVGNEDWVDYVSPMNSAWDPESMLERIDKQIARDTQMNKLMLEGDPAGYLSASETAINNWESKVKESQAWWLIQFKPILVALGAGEDVQFQTPSKPTFISLMEGLLAARQALEGIVRKQDIVDLINEYLESHGHKRDLQVAEEGEWQETPTEGEENGNSGQDRNNGSKGKTQTKQ